MTIALASAVCGIRALGLGLGLGLVLVQLPPDCNFLGFLGEDEGVVARVIDDWGESGVGLVEPDRFILTGEEGDVGAKVHG
jgi:hypothetical protein